MRKALPLLVAILLIGAPLPARGGTSEAAVTPPTQDAVIGETVTIGIHISPAEPISGISLILRFNPLIVNPSDITEGDLGIPIWAKEMDNSRGKIKLAGTLLKGNTVSSPGIFATITFTARGMGSSTIKIENLEIKKYDAQGNPITVQSTAQNGEIRVTSEQVPPVVDFTYSPLNPLAGHSVSFTSLSFDPDGYIAGWRWDFGDNTSSNLENPSHTFMSPGTYHVTLTVADNSGLQSSITKMLEVVQLTPNVVKVQPYEKSVAVGETFEENIVVDPEEPISGVALVLRFDPSVIHALACTQGDLGIPLLTRKIDNESGTVTLAGTTTGGSSISSEGTFARISFKAVGAGESNLSIENLEVKKYDENGVPVEIPSTPLSGKVTVRPASHPPVAVIRTDPSPPKGLAPLTVKFYGGDSYDPDGVIVGYEWDFGDGTSGEGADVEHTYSSAGIYYATLTVTDNSGMTGENRVSVNVAPEENVVIRIEPAFQSVKAGAGFEFGVQVTTGPIPVWGLQLTLSFDPSLALVENVEKGEFASGENVFFSYALNNAAGKIENIICAIPGGRSEGGELVRIRMKAQEDAEGSMDLSISDVIAGTYEDNVSVQLPVTVIGGKITISTAGECDLNGDGVVNVLDMIKVVLQWGRRGTPGWIPEDLTKDGFINILDLIVIAAHFG